MRKALAVVHVAGVLMTKLGISTGIVLAVAGASCAVDAWAADTPVKTPPAAAASAPKTCTDGWGFIFTDCQLTWQGITVYGTIDTGFGCRATARRRDPRSAVRRLHYLIQKQNNLALWGPAPNALTNSFIGIKGTEPIGGERLCCLCSGRRASTRIPCDSPMDRDRSLRTPASPKTLQPPSPIRAERASGSTARVYVGVSSPTYGALTVFRQNSLTLDAVFDYDPFGASYGFSPIGFQGITCGGGNTENCRNSTSLKYRVNVGQVPGGGAVAVRRLRPEQCLQWCIPVPGWRRYFNVGQRCALGRRNLQPCQRFRVCRTCAGKQ